MRSRSVYTIRSLPKTCCRRIEISIEADCKKQCPIVQELNLHKRATTPQVSTYTSQVFEKLFPGTPFAGLPGPAVNALLATLYISGPPSQCCRSKVNGSTS